MPAAARDFLLRVDLESFAFSPVPLLFEPSALGWIPRNPLLGKCLCVMAHLHVTLLISPAGLGGKQALIGYQLGALHVQVEQVAGLTVVLAHKELQWSDKSNT